MSTPIGDDDRLESWKEIAAYLGREVRTVQLWEKSEGLPIHRHQHARQGSVYASKAELDAWREARKNSAAPIPPAPAKSRIIAILAGIAVFAIATAAVFFFKDRKPSGDLPSAVAVLPFLDLSPQKDSEYFSDGLTEEVIDALSRVPNLRVVARTSAFAFKGKDTDIRQIGKQLNVNAVIEGSVRRSGDRLRITAQLNRVSDGYHMWSRTYDRELRDVFAVQREISQSIANELRAGQIPDRPRQPTEDLEAYRLYQEAKYFFNKFEPPDSDYKAIERYKQAIARDPNFAAAYAGMADAYSYLAENFVVAPREVMPKAKEAATKALELDPNSAEAHTSLGIVKLDYERDREGGQQEFLRALQLNPGFGWARHWYAHSLESQEKMEDALREMRASLDLDPLSAPINWDIAAELITLKRYDEALRLLDKAGELFPGIPVFDLMKVCAHYRKGDQAEARAMIASLRKRPELLKDPSYLPIFAAQAAYDGQISEARHEIAELEAMRKKQYIEPFLLVEVCIALHDRRELMLWLRRADEERSTFFVYRHGSAEYWGLTPDVLDELDRGHHSEITSSARPSP